MSTTLDELESLLKADDRFTSDGHILKNKIIELALKSDEELLSLLLSEDEIADRFFVEAGEALVFDQDSFVNFVSNKEFLPDSYTQFKNKIGLVAGDEYYQESKEVELAWPYKDCVLEGDQEDTEEERNEIFWNETLAPDEIDRLLHPKVLTNFNKHGEESDAEASNISADSNFFVRGNNLLALHSLKERFRRQCLVEVA